MVVDKYDKLKFASALRVRNLNTLGIKVGDRVSVRMGYELDDDNCHTKTKELTGDVAEIDLKGRWFRIVTKRGFSHCHLFADTYDNGRKYGYRVLRRR